jgi:phosphonate transport system substrate-binding protein
MKTLRAVSFLAPNQLPTQRFVVEYVGRQLGCPVEFIAGESYEQVYATDLSFICGLPYVLRSAPRQIPAQIEPIVAPVLAGERYQNKPIYFSDVIVRHDSPFHSFADLRGRSWAYNEPESQSGYGITRYTLVKMGETSGFFGRVLQAGFHQDAIRMVANGQVDAAAIDCQVLELELRAYPELAAQIRMIDALGPSTIQPVTVACHLPANLKADLRAALVGMHLDPAAKDHLLHGLIDHFAPVTDADYDDIRDMLVACEAANFMTLK